MIAAQVSRRPTTALLRGNLLLPFFCAVAVVGNHAIFHLGSMPFVWTLLLVLTVVLLAIMAPQFDVANKAFRWPALINVGIGITVLAPLLAALGLSWNREFPFSGDHYFHVGQAYRIAFWWLSSPGSDVVKVPSIEDVRNLFASPQRLLWSRAALVFAIAAITIIVYCSNRLASLVGFVTATVLWGLFEHTIFLRYPGGGYVAVMPFLGPGFLAGNVELAGRLVGVFAAIAWLFLLRPWLIGRWPDVRILPAAILLLWHKDVIWYFNSVYLEPWAFVFCLLAVEVLVTQGRWGAPLACLLIGAAATVKEPVILVLPLVWLAGAPWRSNWRERATISAAALAAGFPFMLYYFARKSVESGEADRGFQFGLPPSLWTYGEEFWRQLQFAFPGSSGLLAIISLALLPYMLWRMHKSVLPLMILFAAGLGLVLFFAVDQQSQANVGYFRFLLYALPFLAAGAVAMGYAVTPRSALIAGITAAALQAPNAWTGVARAASPATDGNFVEYYNGPLFFPFKHLIAQAEREKLLHRNAPILANTPDPSIRPLPGINVSYGSPGEIYCTCSSEHPNILALFVRFGNMNAGVTKEMRDERLKNRMEFWHDQLAQRPACLAMLRQTCSHVLERREGGEPVAVLGIR